MNSCQQKDRVSAVLIEAADQATHKTDALYWLISLLKAEALSRSKSHSPVTARVRRCSAIS